MRLLFGLAILAIAWLPQAIAHYRFASLINGGVTTTAFQYVRQSTNWNSPVTDVTSNDLRCNVGATTATGTADVAAGSTVGFALDQAIYHPGVLNVYLSKAPFTAASYDGSGKWFKIYQISPVISGGSITFPTDNLATVTFKIPASTPSGYAAALTPDADVDKIEHIALHVASSTGGAQFYIACAQINVTGGGSGNPSPVVNIPGVYTATDPGILINIYWPIELYRIQSFAENIQPAS
ncbi:hypothetical protein FRC17_000172 [Serendipita sp. 399]|nr:hypothetical protein FRC17_000172 [Serendipita sp. 399]